MPVPDADRLWRAHDLLRAEAHDLFGAQVHHQALYDWLGALTNTVRTLEGLLTTLASHTARYQQTAAGRGEQVRDDAGDDPKRRLAIASKALSGAGHALGAVEAHLIDAHNAIAQVGTQPVDSNEG